MNNIKRFSFLTFCLSGLVSILVIASPSNASGKPDIALEQIEKDLNFLASDEMAGRGNFSKEINLAADYIAKRFSEFGLTGTTSSVDGIKSFKQSFSVFQLKPKALKVTLNGKTIVANHIMAVSNKETLQWNNTNSVKTHVFTSEENFRQVITKLNQEGGLHFVLVDKHHQAIFNRYRQFFHRGLIKETITESGAIIVVLSDDTEISNYQVDATFDVVQKTLTNVIGILPGKTKPEEMVLFSAHYDHLGVTKDKNESALNKASAKKVNKDTPDLIYNGADDDASGTTGVLSLARYFSQANNNSRTLVFVAFSGEEIGGFGSKYFSKQLSPGQITAMINLEMIGKPSKFGIGKTWMTGTERSNLFELLNKRLATNEKEIFADPYPKQGLFYRSDNATLAKLGVPAHSFGSTQIDKDEFYHQVSDEVETLNTKSMQNVIQTLAESVKGLVDGVDTPSRIEPLTSRPQGKIF